ncbi:hypothetical protein FJY68_08675 [candidate division WOR-3 bacterium]|uniref:Uncharacterized protein n=1 Tax=candidate division WOR-3 bacterium TaxID=2052148 RepID=A0A938BRR9_UNCW3|nr:hypothetical protein [candidate division WOR-3 bacterium]
MLSVVIVADLTDERPNCYLEVGYAMGLDKFQNLILTARYDHDIRARDHVPNGPKVHFDLDSYNILYWRPDELAEFKEELEKRIKRRLVQVLPAEETRPKLSEVWLNKQREAAKAGQARTGETGAMEVVLFPLDSAINLPQGDLLRIAESAQISSGMLGVVARNGENDPKPTSDGIRAEFEGFMGYAYWTLRKDGTFYSFDSHGLAAVDAASANTLYYHRLVHGVTEMFLYANRLYSRLGLGAYDAVSITLGFSGIKGRDLRAPTDRVPFFTRRVASDDPASQTAVVRMRDIEVDLVNKVSQFVSPVLSLFNFFRLEPAQLNEMVETFVRRASGGQG